MSDEQTIDSPRGAPFYLNGVLVEPDALLLSDGPRHCRVEPKVMALLAALAERPGQLWERSALLTRLWCDSVGSDEALTRLMYQLRRAFKAAGISPAALRTLPKLGYRLDAEVEPADAQRRADRPTPSAWPAFSIAVLPVADLSEDGQGRLLADGLTRDLTMLLSRTPRFRVAPHSSASRHAADASRMEEIGEVLHSRYLVSATLARFDDSVSLRVDLIDAAEGVLLWANKYQAGFDRFFEIEETVVHSITTAISTQVNATQPVRTRRTGRFNLSAYERVQAAEALRLNYGRENAGRIVAMLQEALAIEPDDPITRAALAVQLSQNVVSQWVDDAAATIQQVDALIADALVAAPSDPEVRAAAGIVATMLCRPDEAIAHLELATAANPSDPHALAVLGWQLCLRHADPGGIGLIETAEARAPHHPRFGLWATYRATGHLFMLHFDDGLRGAQEAMARTPHYYQPNLTCAWAHTGLGDLAAARQAIARAVALESPGILDKFVIEMRKWSANSPHQTACWEVLDTLQGLGDHALA